MMLITPLIALGDRNDPIRHASHIDALLWCACELPLLGGKPSHHLPLQDGVPATHEELDAAFQFLDRQLHDQRMTLVYCGHGLSRSVSVLTGYPAWKSGEWPEAVLNQIRKLRPEINPSAPTFQSIVHYVNQKRAGEAP